MVEIKYRSELYKLLPGKAHVAEIGVAEGLFSEQILSWGIEKLYLVDAWTKLDQTGDGGFEQDWHDKNMADCLERLKRLKGKFEVLRGLSHEQAKNVSDGSLDMVYLDGDHSFAGVQRDLIHWFPKLKPGGIMAGHDYLSEAYGVKRAVHQFCEYCISRPTIIPENQECDAGFWFQKRDNR